MTPSPAIAYRPPGAAAAPLDPWFIANLVCPIDTSPLIYDRPAAALCCPRDHRYPVADGIPVMLVPQARPTNTTALAETRAALAGRGAPPDHAPAAAGGPVDSYVQAAIGATNGRLYAHLRGRLTGYPIPLLDLPPGGGRPLLDVGSNWGRWTVAAARLGYTAVGIDPSLAAIAAARRVAGALGANSRYLVADARYLPFRPGFFAVAFSYSVLQHFAPEDCAAAVAALGRVTAPGGLCKVQMLQPWGARALYHQIRRGLRRARDFEVRYWPLGRLATMFAVAVGPAAITVDGFFSANARPEDRALLPWRYRMLVAASARLMRLSRRWPLLLYAADSVWITARRPMPAEDR